MGSGPSSPPGEGAAFLSLPLVHFCEFPQCVASEQALSAAALGAHIQTLYGGEMTLQVSLGLGISFILSQLDAFEYFEIFVPKRLLMEVERPLSILLFILLFIPLLS